MLGINPIELFLPNPPRPGQTVEVEGAQTTDDPEALTKPTILTQGQLPPTQIASTAGRQSSFFPYQRSDPQGNRIFFLANGGAVIISRQSNRSLNPLVPNPIGRPGPGPALSTALPYILAEDLQPSSPPIPTRSQTISPGDKRPSQLPPIIEPDQTQPQPSEGLGKIKTQATSKEQTATSATTIREQSQSPPTTVENRSVSSPQQILPQSTTALPAAAGNPNLPTAQQARLVAATTVTILTPNGEIMPLNPYRTIPTPYALWAMGMQQTLASQTTNEKQEKAMGQAGIPKPDAVQSRITQEHPFDDHARMIDRDTRRLEGFSFATSTVLAILNEADLLEPGEKTSRPGYGDGHLSRDEITTYLRALDKQITEIQQIIQTRQSGINPADSAVIAPFINVSDDELEKRLKRLFAKRRRARMLKKYFSVIAGILGDKTDISADDIRQLAAMDGNPDTLSYQDLELYLQHFAVVAATHHPPESTAEIPLPATHAQQLEPQEQLENPAGTPAGVTNQNLALDIRALGTSQFHNVTAYTVDDLQNVMLEIELLAHHHRAVEEGAAASADHCLLTREDLADGLNHYRDMMASLAPFSAYPSVSAQLTELQHKWTLGHFLWTHFDTLSGADGDATTLSAEDVTIMALRDGNALSLSRFDVESVQQNL